MLGRVLEWLVGQIALRGVFSVMPDWAKWAVGISFLAFITVALPAILYVRAKKNGR